MVPFLAECWDVKLHSSTRITFSSVFYFVCLLFSFMHFYCPTEKFSWSLSQGSETSSCNSCATQPTKCDTYHVSVYVFFFFLNLTSYCFFLCNWCYLPVSPGSRRTVGRVEEGRGELLLSAQSSFTCPPSGINRNSLCTESHDKKQVRSFSWEHVLLYNDNHSDKWQLTS